MVRSGLVREGSREGDVSLYCLKLITAYLYGFDGLGSLSSMIRIIHTHTIIAKGRYCGAMDDVLRSLPSMRLEQREGGVV